ncbi:hypothetical protein BYT27DRAFT_7258787 [Phlegmacium glaucopus]|nr:hypothetical protein BYT27DRAFT_7258787 [Phlegmacium glaucopus]
MSSTLTCFQAPAHMAVHMYMDPEMEPEPYSSNGFMSYLMDSGFPADADAYSTHSQFPHQFSWSDQPSRASINMYQAYSEPSSQRHVDSIPHSPQAGKMQYSFKNQQALMSTPTFYPAGQEFVATAPHSISTLHHEEAQVEESFLVSMASLQVEQDPTQSNHSTNIQYRHYHTAPPLVPQKAIHTHDCHIPKGIHDDAMARTSTTPSLDTTKNPYTLLNGSPLTVIGRKVLMPLAVPYHRVVNTSPVPVTTKTKSSRSVTEPRRPSLCCMFCRECKIACGRPPDGSADLTCKPSKWFSHSVSASKAPSLNPEPRPSVSSSRKHKISHPTDPRPILDDHTRSASRLDLFLKLSTRQFLTQSFLSFSSNASFISPSGVFNGRHAFPTLSSTPSSSPLRTATLPSVSISISAPTLDDGPVPITTSPAHLHTRSQSFTPKLPSKLAIPRQSPSPQRTPLSTNNRQYDARDHDRSLISPTKFLLCHRPTTPLPLPFMISQVQNQEVEEKSDMKRSSQIVLSTISEMRRVISIKPIHSSLKAGNLTKSSLKASNSTSTSLLGIGAAVKELFPTGLVPPSEQDMDEVNSEHRIEGSDDATARKAKAKEEGAGTVGRRKGAFWGRRTHPHLIMDTSGIIEKGTFESLVHEAVSATTFLDLKAGDSGEKNADKTANRKRWHEFAFSVLFSIPSIVGRQAFKLEFTRCCSYLIGGVEDEIKDVQVWKQETIPGVSLSAETAAFSSGLPVSTSTQAVYHPLPLVNNTSPNANTFLPRPKGNTSAGQNPSTSFASPSSPIHRSEDRSGSQTSRTHPRSEVISVWAKVGELCQIAGDECLWQAISAALCSRPISRLDKAWKRVDPQALSAIKSWVHATNEKENISVGQPQVTPWGGDVKAHIIEE